MAKLPPLSAAAVRRVLEAHGFEMVRRRGSHMVMQKRSERTTITAIVPDHRELAPGTLASIIRQSRLPRSAFRRR